jgi:hypothetical protein
VQPRIEYHDFDIERWSAALPTVLPNEGGGAQAPATSDNTKAAVAFFAPTMDFIRAAVDSGGAVLIHCFAGAHRAGTTGIAWLMHEEGLSAVVGTAVAQQLRPIIDPKIHAGLDNLLNLLESASTKVAQTPLPSPSSPSTRSSSGAEMEMEECPICMVAQTDVQVLDHATNGDLNVASHKACGTCRTAMLERNQRCPWCRSEVVWKQVLDFLDSLKKDTGAAHDPHTLADLMSKWEIYELTRQKSDIILFAKDMVEDVAMCAHIDRAIRGNAAWLRDSSGLWCRFHAMVEERELVLAPPHACRLQQAVDCGMASFRSNGGGAAEHGGAMYTQLCVAILCAKQSGMHIMYLCGLARQIGLICVQFWKGQKAGVRDTLVDEYCIMVTDDVWNTNQGGTDAIISNFF